MQPLQPCNCAETHRNGDGGQLLIGQLENQFKFEWPQLATYRFTTSCLLRLREVCSATHGSHASRSSKFRISL